MLIPLHHEPILPLATKAIGGITTMEPLMELPVGKVLSLPPTRVGYTNGVEQWMLLSVSVAVVFALRVGIYLAIVNGCI